MKKWILIFICAALLSISIPSLAAEPSDELVYTALGDSIVAGFALPSYTDDGNTPKEGYVAIIGEKLGASVINDLGVSGVTTQGVINRLNGNEIYKNAVKSADVITISLGSNDLLIPGMSIMEEIFNAGGFDFSSIAESEASAAAAMFSEIKAYLDAPAQQERLSSMLEGFKSNWTLIIDKIRELNPNAAIIVTDYFNPFYAIDVLLPEKIFQPYIDAFNEYIYSHEYNGEKYSIASIRELGESVGLTNFNLIFKNFDVHPSVKGHALIARRVWEAYSGKPLEENTVTEKNDTEPFPETTFTPEQTSSSDTSKKGCAGFPAASLFSVILVSFAAVTVIKRK